MTSERWWRAVVDPHGDHHVVDGEPMYAARFDRVLPFHAPGLAPVRRGADAWHIDATGSAAYEGRFRQTFGFYENLAAVEDVLGWCHIHPTGVSIYVERYAWCGNYQGGRCAVRLQDGRYRHLDTRGTPVSGATWRYAGDYREGAAVVQADDGRSTHVDPDGELVHARWFLDLDVFHKGFARARDGRGWHHVDRTGTPAYERRFAAVEPFYNGQARVEREDGGLEIIDEGGATVLELRGARQAPEHRLSADLVGYWRTWTLAAAAELRVMDALPATTEEVAARCGIAVANALRLLRGLAELGTVEGQGGRWHATARGAALRTEHPASLRGAALEYTSTLAAPWSRLVEALRSDAWAPRDPFSAVADNPVRAKRHHEMLRSYARIDYGAVTAALRLRGDETVIDAGGGLGVLAASILGAHSDARVVLLDRPEVVAYVETRDPRLAVRAHDLFEPWGVQADVVVLARVLHDWDDERALTILRHARAALPVGGRLHVVEMVLDDAGPSGGLVDLHLLAVSGGRERTAAEYEELFERAGFALEVVVPLPAVPSLVVGVAR